MDEMEWQQLEYFCVVAKTEHFRKAAELLNISQPALSRSIKKLEEELGICLFDRIGRSVKLNQFGRVFLKRVENGLNEISYGVEEINHLKNPYTGTCLLLFYRRLESLFCLKSFGILMNNIPLWKFNFTRITFFPVLGSCLTGKLIYV